VLDHPFTVGPEGPLGAARLASTPSRMIGLGSGLPSENFWTGSPNLGGALPTVSSWMGKNYQGSALPLSYGSEL